MATYVIAVFGSQLNKSTGTFPPFVYDEIDAAVQLAEQKPAALLALCGSHPLKEGERGLPKECDVAESYVKQAFPEFAHPILTEGRSTTIPDNWLFLRVALEANGISRPDITLVTITPLLPRVRFFGSKIFGNTARLRYKTAGAPSGFDNEPRLLGDAKCTLKNMKPGDISFLLNPDGSSKWNELRLQHRACPQYGGLHS